MSNKFITHRAYKVAEEKIFFLQKNQQPTSHFIFTLAIITSLPHQNQTFYSTHHNIRRSPGTCSIISTKTPNNFHQTSTQRGTVSDVMAHHKPKGISIRGEEKMSPTFHIVCGFSLFFLHFLYTRKLFRPVAYLFYKVTNPSGRERRLCGVFCCCCFMWLYNSSRWHRLGRVDFTCQTAIP